MFYSWNVATLSTQSLKTIKVQTVPSKGFASNLSVSLDWSGCRAGIKIPFNETLYKQGIFSLWTEPCNAVTLVGQILLLDNSLGEFVPIDVAKFYRVFVLPQTDQRLKIPKVWKISGNFSEFLHVQQHYKSQSLSEKQLNLYQVLTFSSIIPSTYLFMKHVLAFRLWCYQLPFV